MSLFLNKFNSDDVFFRSCILGLLNVMNEKLFIWNRIDENDFEKILVPFYYSMSGDERFMQDIFLYSDKNSCDPCKIVEGNINKIPSGVINISGINFDTSRMSNRFVRGEYQKIENNDLKTYNSYHNLVPVNIAVEVEIKTDSQIDLMKMIERLITVFYKTHKYSIIYNSRVVGCIAGFPEDYSTEKSYEFTFGDDTTSKITFNLEIETYYPIIDITQEFNKNQQIEKFSVTINPNEYSNTTEKNHLNI